MSEIFPNNNPEPVTERLQQAPYSRYQRRHCVFVLQNLQNGLYIARTASEGKVTYSDTTLEQASGFKYTSLKHVASEIPSVSVAIRLVYKDKNRKFRTL